VCRVIQVGSTSSWYEPEVGPLGGAASTKIKMGLGRGGGVARQERGL
jgi:hypothetical protein